MRTFLMANSPDASEHNFNVGRVEDVAYLLFCVTCGRPIAELNDAGSISRAVTGLQGAGHMEAYSAHHELVIVDMRTSVYNDYPVFPQGMGLH